MNERAGQREMKSRLTGRIPRLMKMALLAAAAASIATFVWPSILPFERVAHSVAEAQQRQTRVNPKSAGCIVCHTGTESMHIDGDDSIGIGCADCHGGDPARD